MKNKWTIALLMFLLSCGGEETNSNSNQNITSEDQEDTSVKYNSPLRPDQEEWDLSLTYIDTVDFVSYNDDADYAFLVVKTNSGEDVSMVYSEWIDEEYVKGNQMIIEWGLDSLYEAGEGDELYFQERILSFELIGDKVEFSRFLEQFGHKYQAGSKDGFIHSEVGSYTAFNPGAYCVLGDAPSNTNGDFIDMETDHIITDRKPDGGFCEGYNEEPGLYFEFIEEKDFPGYADLSGDQEMFKTITPEISVPYDKVAKVLVINRGYFNRYIYFYRSEGQWYLWIEDYCDCSA